MEAQGSVMTNKYAEGYPRKRWYGGCENVDTAEQLAIDRAKRLFSCEHVNVQPTAAQGEHGGLFFDAETRRQDSCHESRHGASNHGIGEFFRQVLQRFQYGVGEKTSRSIMMPCKNKRRKFGRLMITAGASAYPRIIDFPRCARSPNSVGAILFIDMAHIAGLVAVISIQARFRTRISSPPRRTKVCAAPAGASLCAKKNSQNKSMPTVFQEYKADAPCT